MKWTAERREAFLADYGGRDLVVHAELALDREGTFLGFRAAPTPATWAPTPSRSIRSTRAWRSRAPSTVCPPRRARARRGHQHVADHAVPQRGPSRDHVRHGAADRPRRAPPRIRSSRAAAEEPRARERDAVPERRGPGLRQRRLPGRPRPRGRPRRLDGIRGPPRRGAPPRAGIAGSAWPTTSSSTPASRASAPTSPCVPRGAVDLVLGTLSSGQGHATSFAQLLVEWLGVELSEVRLITGRHRRHRGRRRAPIPRAPCGWPRW